MTITDEFQATNAGDLGYRRIRTDIILGRLEPGQHLRLETLKQDYGLSVSTLREILNRLTADKLVVAEGNRGFAVAPISVEDLRELTDLRQVLESHAISLSFERGDVEWEGRVVSAHHKLAATERLKQGDIDPFEQWKRYDGEFHQALISNCGSTVLMETHAAIFDRYFRYQTIAFKFRDAPVQQHLDLLECAIARDADRARNVLKMHLSECLEYAIAHWPE